MPAKGRKRRAPPMRSIDPGAIRESKCLIIEPTSEIACLLVVVVPSSVDASFLYVRSRVPSVDCAP